MKLRITHLFIAVLVSTIFSTSSFAVKPVYTGGAKKAAIRGYDTVAYFTEEKAVKGNEEITYEHLGATWFFSSEDNKQLFIENPEKYMPQYGGYCAYAVSRKKSASSKPDYFTIHDGKLYLNYSSSVYKRWIKDPDGYISSADENWSYVLAK